MKIIFSSILLYCLLALTACGQTNNTQNDKSKSTSENSTMNNSENKMNNPYYSRTDKTKLNVTNEEWKKVLPADVYEVSRLKDTERPFTGKYWDYTGKGTYYCAACGNGLFRSDAKFSSSCGWPSFFEQQNPNSVVYESDNSYGMIRTEALCGRCGGHLGHLFDDGPAPTGKRYCMNSIVLDFEPDGTKLTTSADDKTGTVVLGGGCYWCVEAVYQSLMGVISVESGFSGGEPANPSYEQVCTGKTNHAEVVKITYDKTITNLDEIYKVFFTVHDPTTLNRQGADVGTQYRSVIFYQDEEQKKSAESLIAQLNNANVYISPIVTTLEPFKAFYKAKAEHQNYYNNNKEQSYCRMVIQPKIEKFEKVFKDRLKN